jgi:hypothetical protein
LGAKWSRAGCSGFDPQRNAEGYKDMKVILIMGSLRGVYYKLDGSKTVINTPPSLKRV